MNLNIIKMGVEDSTSSRDLSIDLLRFIALTGIIIVHIHPSDFWVQLRNFDVPLMVFLSGVSYKLSGGNRQGYGSYCIKRFKRLILPVWSFLPIYFLLYILGTQMLPPLKTVISYFTLMTGWYVWIIRVFFVIALLAPFLSRSLDRMDKRLFLGLALSFLLLFEWYVNTKYSFFMGRTLVLTHIPYILVFAFGYKIMDFSRKEIIWLMLINIFVYTCMLAYYINKGYLLTQYFKYPPQIYYLSYAMGCCLVLWLVRGKMFSFFERLSPKIVCLMAFIGSHTIWIYLWHIPLVSLGQFFDSAFVRFIFVYALATTIAYCQTWVVKKALLYVKDPKWKKNLGMIFIG